MTMAVCCSSLNRGKTETVTNQEWKGTCVGVGLCLVFLFFFLSTGYYILLVAVGSKQKIAHTFFSSLMKGSMNGAEL